MSFDSNPQAVYHGAGFAELRQVAQTTFDFESATDNDAVISDSGTAITVADFTGRVLLAKITRTGGTTGVGVPASGWIDMADISAGAHATGTELSGNGDTVALPGQVPYFISRGAGGHVVMASSDVSVSPGTGAGDEATLTLYEIM